MRRGRRKRRRCERTKTAGGVPCRCSRPGGKCGRCEARPEDEFAVWKTNFGKEYPDAAAESAAYEAWLVTHNEIAEHNRLLADGESHGSHTRNSDMTRAEKEAFKMQHKGAARVTYIGDLPAPFDPEEGDFEIPGASSRSSESDAVPHWPLECDTTPPSPVVTCPSPEGWGRNPVGAVSCDWSGNGNDAANYLPREIGDQSPCNDCYSFALTNALYAALAIREEVRTGPKSSKPKLPFKAFSTKQIMSLPNMRFPQEQGGQSTTTVSPCPTSDKVSQLKEKMKDDKWFGKQFDEAFLCGKAAREAFPPIDLQNGAKLNFLPDEDWNPRDCVIWPFTSTVNAINDPSPIKGRGCPNGLGHPWVMGSFVHQYMDGLCSLDDFPDFVEYQPLCPCTPSCGVHAGDSPPQPDGWMNGQGENPQCCLGGLKALGKESITPDYQHLCDTKCPPTSNQCKPKARLTKQPRLLGMQNDTTACFVSDENPKGFDTGTPEYIDRMFFLLDETVRAQPVSVLISAVAIQQLNGVEKGGGRPNRLKEKDVTGLNCPAEFTTIMQSELHWVALVGVTICDGQSSAWPCDPGDPTPREYWKFRNSWGNLTFSPRAYHIHVPTSGNEKESHYAFGYFYMERATWKNVGGEWKREIINPCGLLNGDGYNLGGVVVPPIDGIELVP